MLTSQVSSTWFSRKGTRSSAVFKGTHRFPAEQAPAAFGLLDQHLDQALGVLLEWTQE